MPYSFYMFDTASWTEEVKGNFFETTSGSERLIGDTTGKAGDQITFNGYTGAQKIEISGNTLSDSTGSGTLTSPISVNGKDYSGASGNVELDLGFVLRDPATNTYYFVGYVTIGNEPVGSVISQGWNPASPNEWQPRGPSAGTELVLTNITTSQPPNNPFLNNTSLGPRFASSSFNPFSNDVVLSSGIGGVIDSPSEIMCFCSGTLILTDKGERAIEDLLPGDMILTRDNGYQPLAWIGRKRLDARHLAENPDLRPILIRAGALGPNIPSIDLAVSPQHRVMVRSNIAQRMFGCREILVAAKQLIAFKGIERDERLEGVTYYHMLFSKA